MTKQTAMQRLVECLAEAILNNEVTVFNLVGSDSDDFPLKQLIEQFRVAGYKHVVKKLEMELTSTK